jgi:homoserine/homoserine lactone efflux protein
VLKTDEPMLTRRQLYIRGLSLAVTNPKAVAFFTAIFPQFVSPQAPLWTQFLTITLTFMTISFASLLTYAKLSQRLTPWFQKPTHALWFNRTSGGILMALGLQLALTRRAN